ncbi:MAG: hypothetical protein NTV28_14620 [Propionibacteriales bacterium]|nr:hypothetical protein [Propionibacteriales bacterium]
MAERDDGTPDDDGEARRGSDRDAFDAIVERLDLDLPFPLGVERPVEPEPDPEPVELDDLPDPVDEQFYRNVRPGPARPLHRGRAAAWAGLAGSPLLLVLATVGGSWLSRPVLLGAALTFVASAIYLIAQLPEHGPGQQDWPDDGAAL